MTGRPYVTLGESERPVAEEHHDAVQLLVINTLRKFTGTLLGALRDASSAHEMLASTEIMERAYFSSSFGELRLMGQHEVAEFLGVSNQRVGQLDKQHKDFPPPVARLACGPVWLAADIERFLASWDRRTGRRKKEKEKESDD